MTVLILASPFFVALLILVGVYLQRIFEHMWWERKTLDRYASTLYGLQRKRFESNRSLRARCAVVLGALAPNDPNILGRKH